VRNSFCNLLWIYLLLSVAVVCRTGTFGVYVDTFIARLKILSYGGAGYVNVESSNVTNLVF
jgi:hypothetical protein